MKIQLELTQEEVDQLRFLLTGLPICVYGTLIAKVLPKLFESASASPHAAAADLQARVPTQPAGGFSLSILTPKAQRLAPEIARMLGRLDVEL